MVTVTIKRVDSKKKKHFLFLCLSCLLLSLFVHLLFFEKAKQLAMQGFAPESYDTIVPRTFKMKRVEIDPKILDPEATPQQKNLRADTHVELQKENPLSEDYPISTGEKKDFTKPQENKILLEKPVAELPLGQMDSLSSKKGEYNPSALLQEVEKMGKSDLGQGIEETMKLPEPASIERGNAKTANPSEKSSSSQFSTIDDLLSSTENVKKNTAPILMPTDLLFEYDSDALKPAATGMLSKLGSLIKKNAQASFLIEGHTDSFGSDEYNTQLSVRRAEAVKTWLLTNMGLDASRISTIGLGKSRLLVPATGTVEQQQLNRRVEIVISLPK